MRKGCRLNDLKETNAAVVGDILGQSFADDPVNDWIFTNVKGKATYFAQVAKKKYQPEGFGHVDTEQRGASMWLPPGVSKEIPVLKSLDIAAGMVRNGGLKSLLRGIKFDVGMESRKLTVPYFYLFAIGTTPEARGHGVGGKMMEAGLKVVDSQAMPAYLESSKPSNITFYRRYGFEVIEEFSPAAGCPPLWLMWREANLGVQ